MRILPFLSVLALMCSHASAAVIVVDHLTEADVYDDGDGSSDYQETYDIFIPQTQTVEATIPTAFAQVALDWSDTGGVTTFSYNVVNSITGSTESSALGGGGFIFFVTSDYTYTISGTGSFTVSSGLPAHSEFGGILYDITDDVVLWQYAAVSDSTDSRVATFDAPDSDPFNFGSLTGNLQAWHAYYYAGLSEVDSGEVEGSATFSLQLTQVPDSGATIVLFGGALAGLVALRRFSK